MTVFTWVFQGGKKKVAVTSITLVNATAKTQDVTVPAAKRWLLLTCKMVNMDDVTRNLTMNLYKEAAKTNLIGTLAYKAAADAGGGSLYFPNFSGAVTDLSGWDSPRILGGSETLSFIWASGGASTGSVDADGLVITYLEMDD